MIISEKQYQDALAAKNAADEILFAYARQKENSWQQRWARFIRANEAFTDADLIYSATARCEKCGAGMAYPKDCGIGHQWTCSNVLKCIGTDNGHTALPFAFYEVKSENQPSANGATTRPKPEAKP